ncbi:MAG: sortase [Anaerolineae bacterium]|nr:sortase [Anaerolineae bacterium]
MRKERQFQHTLKLGIVVAGCGLICLGGGLALLTWRLLEPDDAVLLPPGFVITPEATPTVGVLGNELAPPPPPGDNMQVVMLPVSDKPTATPTAASATPVDTPLPASPTRSPTFSLTPSAAPTGTPAPTATSTPPAVRPVILTTPPTSSTLTATATRTPSPTPTPRPAVPDHILIDAIGLEAPVVPVGQHSLRIGEQVYSQWDVPNVYAAGWHQTSAPLGQPGNTVINGHHNVHGEIFRYLIELEPGDIVTLESQGERYFYLVAQTMTLAEQDEPVEVRQANARWILPTDDERVTLITCWPYYASTHRLIVIALPLSALGLPAEIP